MPKSKINDPPKEDCQQLDIVAVNEKISQVSEDIESFIEAQGKRFDQLEEGLDTRFAEMTKKLTAAISGKRQETRREGHGQKRRKKSEEKAAEPEREDVDEESDEEEGDSKVEVGPADSKKEPAEEHISTGKDKKEEKESKKGKEMEEEEEDKEEIKQKEQMKPADKKKGKEKVSEEVKGPSPTKDELYDAVRILLEEADLETVSWAGIAPQLGARFEVDMSDRKEEVEQIIDDVINKMYVEAIDFEN